MTQGSDPIAERFAPLRNPVDDSDWDAVVQNGRRVPRPAILAAAAMMLAVLVAAPAFGLHEPVLPFLGREQAPKPIVRDFATLDEGAPPGMAPGVIAGETRRVTTVRLSDGGHTLFVAPTRDGGFCLLWTKMWGGCDRYGTVPLSPSFGGEPYVVSGHVDAEWIHGLEIRFTDGSRVEPKVTWVSDPIGAGFFLYEVPAGRTPEALVAVDEDGDIVVEELVSPGSGKLAAPQAQALVERKRLAGEIRVQGQPARVWIAPSNTEGRCAWVEYRGDSVGAFRCLPKRYPSQGIAFGERSLGGARFLVGQVMSRVDSIDLLLESGRSTRIRPFEDVLLAPIPAGEQAEAFIARDAAGKVIVRIPLMNPEAGSNPRPGRELPGGIPRPGTKAPHQPG
jgi:hypothetical protein